MPINLFDFTKTQGNANAMRSQLNPFGATFGAKQEMAPAPYLSGTTQQQANEMQSIAKSVVSKPKVSTPSVSPTSIDSLAISDIKKGMPMAEFDKYYPELKSKKSIFEQYAIDVKSGMPDSEAPKLYPELFGNAKPEDKSFLEGFADKTSSAFKSGIESIQSGAEQVGKGNIISGAVRGASGALEAALSPISGAVGETVSQVTPDSWKQGINEKIAPIASELSSWYETLPQDQKERLKDIGAASNVLLSFVGGKGVAEASKVGGNAVKTGAEAVKTAGGNIVSKTGKLLTKTPEQQASKILGETVEGVIDGQKVVVPKPTSTITQKITSPIRTSDTKVLAGRAIAPRSSGMTPKQKINIVANTENNAKELYKMVRTGKIKGDINTLEDTAQTVVDGLDEVGGKIGEAVKGAKGTVSPSIGTMQELQNIVSNPIDTMAAAFPVLEKFINTTKGGLSIQNAFKAKKIFSDEIRKLSRSGDGGTDAYSALVKGVHELDQGIDEAVSKTLVGPQHAELKSQYATLKKLAGDIVQSAMVEGRRAPQTLAEQMGMLQTITDIIKNPVSGTYRATAGALIKDMADLNTRGGSWKEFVKIMDKRAIEEAKKAQNIVKPVVKPLKKSIITPKKLPKTPVTK